MLLKIFHSFTYKSENNIYLFQYRTCKLQTVARMGNVNICLKHYSKDSKSENSISVCKYFSETKNNFQNTLKLLSPNKLGKKWQLRRLLKTQENFWILLRLKTLYQDGLNQELNNIDGLKNPTSALHNQALFNDTFLAGWNNQQNLVAFSIWR